MESTGNLHLQHLWILDSQGNNIWKNVIYFGNGLEMTVLFLPVLTSIVLIRTDSQVAPICFK